MNVPSRAGAVATAEWSDLLGELDRWGEDGRPAAFWWRDDDAGAMTPQLGRLLALAGAVPLALAVVPAEAGSALRAALAPLPQVAVLQHGWRHANQAVSGKKSEFPPGRAPAEAARDIVAGRKRLGDLFGARALPVFVPPWNRIAPEFVPLLRDAGIAAVSAMAPRDEPTALGPPRIDVDVDLVAWQRGRGFVGEGAALAGLVAALRSPRPGPIGILTHHLVMDAAAADFLARLKDAIAAHRAARWADIGEWVPR